MSAKIHIFAAKYNDKFADKERWNTYQLDEYNRKKAEVEKQISNCDVKLADKQQKLEQKMTELQDIKEKVNFYDVAYVRFDVPEIKNA